MTPQPGASTIGQLEISSGMTLRRPGSVQRWPTPGNLNIAGPANGTYNLSAGAANVTNSLFVGDQPASARTFAISGVRRQQRQYISGIVRRGHDHAERLSVFTTNTLSISQTEGPELHHTSGCSIRRPSRSTLTGAFPTMAETSRSAR